MSAERQLIDQSEVLFRINGDLMTPQMQLLEERLAMWDQRADAARTAISQVDFQQARVAGPVAAMRKSGDPAYASRLRLFEERHAREEELRSVAAHVLTEALSQRTAIAAELVWLAHAERARQLLGGDYNDGTADESSGAAGMESDEHYRRLRDMMRQIAAEGEVDEAVG